MAWPFLRRPDDTTAERALKDALAAAERDRDRWAATADRLQSRVDDLTDRLGQMQREGWRPPAPAESFTDSAPELPDEVTEAITARAGGLHTDLGKRLSAYALQRIMGNAKPDEVARIVWDGEDT